MRALITSRRHTCWIALSRCLSGSFATPSGKIGRGGGPASDASGSDGADSIKQPIAPFCFRNQQSARGREKQLLAPKESWSIAVPKQLTSLISASKLDLMSDLS